MQTQASYDKVLSNFSVNRACAVLRVPKQEWTAPAMQAAIDGGFKTVEFTLTTPGCLDTTSTFVGKDDGVMVGCGTVMNVADAKDAMDAGAEFLVAPCLVPEVVQWCAAHNIVIIPGCGTPTELYAAYKLGAPIQKLFPGVAGGPTWLKAVAAALPMLRINPTSGVSLDNAGEFLSNGAASVGLVAPLFPPDVVAAGDWDQVSENAKAVIASAMTAGPYTK